MRNTALRFGIILSIVSIRTMLAIVMLVQQELRHAFIRPRELQRMIVHLRYNIEDLGCFHSFFRRRTPSERAMLLDEHCRNGIGIDAHQFG